MQGDVVPIIGNRLEYVGCFRIYVNRQGELVIPVGNCRVYVEDEQARMFLDDLLSLAGRFRSQPVSSNGNVAASR
jgi:hypothetical protein